MNRNTIISLAMLYALWESKRQDLLDLIRPFILYAVGDTTEVGQAIDITAVCRYLEKEFGYKSFQYEVVKRVLERETSTSIPKTQRKIEKKNKAYYLCDSYSELIASFSEKRSHCKAHSDAVTTALAEHLNKNNVQNRSNYTQSQAEVILLSFFERQGSAVLQSVDDLRQQLVKNDETDYFVGKFILAEYDRKSVLMDYIIELVKGYFVTTALYLQAENSDVTKASFSNVTFYLDTRLLLGYLGYKSEPENNSVQEMVKSLQRNGAKLACFTYNEDEIENILEAYKQSTLSGVRHSTYTLEHFDELGRSCTYVEVAQKQFRRRLKDGNIITVSPNQALVSVGKKDRYKGILDDDALKSLVLRIKPTYNLTSLPDDIAAINTVSRLREGKKYTYIEKCKAVFVTSNTVLVAATKQYLKQHSIDCGFPIVITGEDLCVMAWLKDFEQDNNLPQMRLLENVLAAITPSKELMDEYCRNLEYMEQQGTISTEEVELLRVDLFAKKELMELTHGDKERLNNKVIEGIREKIKADSFSEGVEKGKADAKKQFDRTMQNRRNAACKRAEDEVESEFKEKEQQCIKLVKVLAAVFSFVFVVASVLSICYQWNSQIRYAIIFLTAVTTIESVMQFLSKNNFLIKHIKGRLQRKKLTAVDKRKREYLSLLENDIVE